MDKLPLQDDKYIYYQVNRDWYYASMKDAPKGYNITTYDIISNLDVSLISRLRERADIERHKDLKEMMPLMLERIEQMLTRVANKQDELSKQIAEIQIGKDAGEKEETK
jgi:hypothetical protein